MYGQFFGSFLLNLKAVTPQQLSKAISEMGKSHIRLGTLAMYKGYMTSDEVDECCFIQRREDKLFGEIALERSYIFQDQLDSLVSAQIPDYLRLGQTLVDSGVLTNSTLHDYLVMYNNANKYGDNAEANITEESEDSTIEIQNFFKHFGREVSDNVISYFQLILSNIVRFLGNDFTPLEPVFTEEYHTNYAVHQHIIGTDRTYDSMIDMEEDVAVAFASRYADMEFTEFDDYVTASMEDFLNLHNGLFCVNMSNMYSKEFTLDAPVHSIDEDIELSKRTVVVPVIFPFGTVYILLTNETA